MAENTELRSTVQALHEQLALQRQASVLPQAYGFKPAAVRLCFPAASLVTTNVYTAAGCAGASSAIKHSKHLGLCNGRGAA